MPEYYFPLNLESTGQIFPLILDFHPNQSRLALFFKPSHDCLHGLMSADDASEIKELLHYEDETAGAIMTTEFVSIVANQTVRSAMYVLKNEADVAETIYY